MADGSARSDLEEGRPVASVAALDGPGAPGGANGDAYAARYAPTHDAPHPAARDDVDPLHCASLEVCRARLALEQPDGAIEVQHGEVALEVAPRTPSALRQRPRSARRPASRRWCRASTSRCARTARSAAPAAAATLQPTAPPPA